MTSCDPTGILANGLAGHWKMDEGSGAVIADSSGNNQILTFTPPKPDWTEGKIGPYAIYDTYYGYGTVNDSSMLEGLQNMSVSAWVYPTRLDGTDRHIVIKGQWNSDPPMSYRLMYQTAWGNGGPTNPKGGWKFHVRTNVGNYGAGQIAGDSDPKENRWHFIAGVYNEAEGKIRVYDDGIEVGISNASGTVNNKVLLPRSFSKVTFQAGLPDTGAIL